MRPEKFNQGEWCNTLNSLVCSRCWFPEQVYLKTPGSHLSLEVVVAKISQDGSLGTH